MSLQSLSLPAGEIPLGVYAHANSPLHACTIVTDAGIYECRMRSSPETLCRQLLMEVRCILS
jgi:hypothetical protein